MIMIKHKYNLMRAKFVNEAIKHLTPKSREEIRKMIFRFPLEKQYPQAIQQAKKYFSDEELKQMKNNWDGKHLRSLGSEKIRELFNQYIPFVSYTNIVLNPNPDAEFGEPSGNLDEVYSIWDSVNIDIPEIEDKGGGVNMIIGVPINHDYKSDDDITIKFYTDSVAFIPGKVNDEYTTWLEPVSITSFTEEDWDGILKELKEYYSIEDDEEDEEDMLDYNE